MPQKRDASRRPSSFVTGMRIEELFGHYDYDIEVPRAAENGVSRICILYGENGTGKTTILQLLFHLLSPADDRGHRTHLAKIPFRNFSVGFSDGTEIRAVRQTENIVGAFTLELVEQGRVTSAGLIGVDESLTVKKDTLTSEGAQMLKEIGKRGTLIFLLGDDRRLVSDSFPPEPEEYERHAHIRYPPEIRTHGPLVDSRDIALNESLVRTREWLRQQVYAASSRGELDAQHIYANIIDQINIHGVPEITDYEEERQKLTQAIKELDARSRPFAVLGLVSRVNSRRFIGSLSDASQEGLKSVAQVVSSFIDSQQARLDALENLNRLLHRFVELVNGFLMHKRVVLSIEEGISIVTDSGARLRPEQLSSGEKQLLLLLCNVLASSQSASLFLIDEPEISLNVKWQRLLIDVLMDITTGSECQFLLASHSLELLSKHRNQAIRLGP